MAKRPRRASVSGARGAASLDLTSLPPEMVYLIVKQCPAATILSLRCTSLGLLDMCEMSMSRALDAMPLSRFLVPAGFHQATPSGVNLNHDSFTPFQSFLLCGRAEALTAGVSTPKALIAMLREVTDRSRFRSVGRKHAHAALLTALGLALLSDEERMLRIFGLSPDRARETLSSLREYADTWSSACAEPMTFLDARTKGGACISDALGAFLRAVHLSATLAWHTLWKVRGRSPPPPPPVATPPATPPQSPTPPMPELGGRPPRARPGARPPERPRAAHLVLLRPRAWGGR